MELRQAENKWWTDKANEIQFYADTNETQFYDAAKAAYAPGITLFTASEPKMVLP